MTDIPITTQSSGTQPRNRSNRWKRVLRRAAPLTVLTLFFLLFGAVLRFSDPVFLSQFRSTIYDEFQNWHPSTFDPDLPVRIVAIDEDSLNRIGQWPWPRQRMAELLDRLTDLGAASVALDFIFSEPDRMSGPQIAAMVPDGPDREQLMDALQKIPDGDALFQQAVARTGAVLGVVMTHAEPVPTDILRDKAGVSFAGDPPQPFLPQFASLDQPLAPFAKAAGGLAALNWIPSRDQVVRDVPLLFALPDGTIAPSLAAEALRTAFGASTYVVRSSNASGQSAFDQSTGINAVRIGPVDVPTTASGSVLIHYSPANQQRHIPAWKVLNGQVAPDDIAGRIILIGATAPGLFDLQSTPIDHAITGIEINAQLIEHILSQNFLQRPDWAVGLEYVVFAILVVVFALLAAVFSPLTTVLIGTAMLAGVFYGSFQIFVHLGLFLDPGFPVFASALAMFAATSWLAIRERADRRWVRDAFGHYVSGDLVEEIVQDPERLSLGGELRTMTVLFSDIRNFTTRAEGMDAQELTGYVNAFLTDLTAVIDQYGGTIDKYMGDAIMAFWNAPLEDPDHAAHACQAALEMLDALEEFNQKHQGTYPRTDIGIGLNTGICCVGNLGSNQRFDYSIIGDEVNVGARLESSTKTYGLSILVGGATAEAARAKGYIFAPVDHVRVKGKDEKIDILTLLGGPDHPVPEAMLSAIPTLEDLIQSYKIKDMETVRLHLDQARSLNITALDGVIAHYDAILSQGPFQD